MTTGLNDFTVRISAYNSGASVATNIANNAYGASYYNKWTKCEVRQTMSQIATFSITLGGVVSTSLPISVGNVLGVYYSPDGSSETCEFVGLVSSVTYVNQNYLQIEGMDFSYRLSKYDLPQKSSNEDKCFDTQNAGITTLQQLVYALLSPTCSTAGGDSLLPIGTIDDQNIPETIKIPLMNHQQAFFYVARFFKERYFYISETDGTVNVKTTRGSSDATGKAYYLTGANTNAILGKRNYTGHDIMNKITVIGHNGNNMATYSDYTTKEAILVSGDNRLIYPYAITSGVGDSTMYLNSVDGFASSGTVILRDGSPSGYVSPFFSATMARINYTGKTSNVLTGCTVVYYSPLNDSVFATSLPVFVADKIYVDSTTPFDSSGEILIGDEVMTYTSKDATSFTIDGSLLYTRNIATLTTLASNISATDTIIPASSSLSGWENSGLIRLNNEYITYNGISGTSFIGCSRGSTATAHSSSEVISQLSLPQLHPPGVLVKQNTDGATDATNSSILVNGLYSFTVQEPNVISKEQVERFASRLLYNNRWGGVYHELYPIDVGGEFDKLEIGDKVTITDTSLGITGYDARAMSMTLSLDRESTYSFRLDTMPYDTAFSTYSPSVSVADYMRMHRSRWL